MILDNSLGFIINTAGRRISQLVSIQFNKYDITTEQWIVLNRLDEQDGISQKDLAKRVEKDQTTVTRILDQLERKGLVQRKTNREDRRSFLIYITVPGKSLNKILTPIEAEVIKTLFENLPEDQIAQLRAIVTQIINNANQQLEEMER
jgi:DNA-binding MarR family transcriptional regulator